MATLMTAKVSIVLSVAALAVLTTPLTASAEIVFLTSGRTLSVQEHRVDGDLMVLTLRSGGQVTCNKDLIEKIEADEVPYPEPPALTVEALSEPTPVQDRSLLDGTPYGDIIASLSEAHGVDPLLVRALIQVESGYRPKARSSRGAMGLMQLMPSTAREYKVRNPFEPKSNIEGGIRHLKSLIDRFGVEIALAAYNAGEGAVRKFNGIPPYRETRKYVSKILSLAGIR
jgi:hypothetical protein